MLISFKIHLVFFIFINSFINNYMQEYNSSIVTDSDITFEQATAGLDIPIKIKKNLTLITVLYTGFDDKIHKGQLLIHKKISAEVKEIFDVFLSKRFPIEKVIPIVEYGWDDNKSMSDNNSSAFNYRTIAGTDKLSNHAHGIAIDINPLQNPFIKGRTVLPKGVKYDKDAKGTITSTSIVVKTFKEKGWEWGGDWKTRKDYQHFEKPEVK